IGVYRKFAKRGWCNRRLARPGAVPAGPIVANSLPALAGPTWLATARCRGDEGIPQALEASRDHRLQVLLRPECRGGHGEQLVGPPECGCQEQRRARLDGPPPTLEVCKAGACQGAHLKWTVACPRDLYPEAAVPQELGAGGNRGNRRRTAAQLTFDRNGVALHLDLCAGQRPAAVAWASPHACHHRLEPRQRYRLRQPTSGGDASADQAQRDLFRGLSQPLA